MCVWMFHKYRFIRCVVITGRPYFVGTICRLIDNSKAMSGIKLSLLLCTPTYSSKARDCAKRRLIPGDGVNLFSLSIQGRKILQQDQRRRFYPMLLHATLEARQGKFPIHRYTLLTDTRLHDIERNLESFLYFWYNRLLDGKPTQITVTNRLNYTIYDRNTACRLLK